MRLLTFSDYRQDTSPIFKSLKVLKLQDIIKFSILKPIYFYFNDQLSWQVKNNFIINESVNLYDVRDGFSYLLLIQLILVQNYQDIMVL